MRLRADVLWYAWRITCLATTSLAMIGPARAQAGAAKPVTDQSSAANGLGLENIVVTGTSRALRKFKAPYAISTLSKQNIRESDPHSVVDLLRGLPGIAAENSGGEGGGENVTIRGLPWAGFRLLDLQEDGVPLFESNYERELQIDELYRVDLNTNRAELVRGGTAPIFSNNASGGALNFITNHGTPTAQHEIQVTGGSHGTARTDFETSGSLTDRLQYSLGGFFRRDDGQRDPGFANADLGGQIKAGATYRLNDNSKIWADYKYLNDRSIFYSSIPLTSPVDGSSLRSLIDPNYGTLDSARFEHVTIKSLNNDGKLVSLGRDLRDGIHPETRTATIGSEFDLGDGWRATDSARYANGSVRFNAINSGTPSTASSLLNGYLGQAKSAFPETSSLRYDYAGTNTPWDPNSTAGLAMTNTWQTAQIDYNDFFNDFRIDKSIVDPRFGHHDVTFGVDLSRFSFKEAQYNNTIVTDVKSNPDLLDIQALNAAGKVVGAVTDKGFSNYGSGDLIGHETGLSTAIYGTENWHITPRWQIDAGVRHEIQDVEGERGIIGTKTVATTGPLAAQTITGLVGYQSYGKILNGTSWTAGSYYQIAKPIDVFLRYSHAYSLPRLSDQWGNINNSVAGTLPNGAPIPTTGINQAEGGIKFAFPTVQLAIIGFYSHFNDLNVSTYVTDAQGLITNQSLLVNTTTYGTEIEGAWHPLTWFELSGSVTLQVPTVDQASTFSSTVSAAAITGRYITRAPRYYFSIQPTYLFTLGGMHGRLYTVIYGQGTRYQDYVNISRLPAYTTIDFGALLTVRKGLDLDFHATNLANSAGLTEGNARAPLSNSLSVADSSIGRPIFGRAFLGSVAYRW